MANATVLSIGGVSVSVNGGYTGNLLKQVSTAYNSGHGTATTLPGGQTNPTMPAAPGTHPNALVIPTDDSGTIVIPPGYDYVLYTGSGTLTGGDTHTAVIGTNLTYSGPAGTVIGTGGTENVTDSTAGATMSFYTGDISLVGQGSSDTIDFDSGLRGSATLGGNNDTVGLGSPLASPSGAASVLGTVTVGLSGSHDVTNITDGSNLVFVTATDTVNQSGGATTLVTGLGGVVSLNATGGTQTVYDNVGGNTIDGGPKTEFTGATGGAENFFNSSTGGADTVFAQTSMDYHGAAAASTLFIGGAGPDTVFAGTNATMFGGTAGGTYTQGTGSFLFTGGGGAGSSDTILGGSTAGNATVWGNNNDNITVSQMGAASGGVYIAFGASDTLNATNARGGNLFTINDQTLAGGANFDGNTTLVGSNAGHDTFDVSHFSQTSAHTITIENWQSSDAFQLSGFSAADQATASSALSAAGGSNATFTLSDNTTIKFMGAAPTSHT